jgi:anti-sigma factor RsiW
MNGFCTGFRELLIDHVDGTLSPADRASASAHEASCAECADLARSVRSQSALLSRLPRPLPPADLGARIERALGSRGMVRRPRRWRAWAAAAAAALVAAIGLFASPRAPDVQRSIRVVDVELPDRGEALGRLSPSAADPGASLLDPLVTPE